MRKPIRFADRAERDVRDIARWTQERFGTQQADRYVRHIKAATRRVGEDPQGLGTRIRDELGPNKRSFHVSHVLRPARHLIVFEVRQNEILILRILHERMDVASQVAPEDDPG